MIVEIYHRICASVAIRLGLRCTIPVATSESRHFMGWLLGLLLLLYPRNGKGESWSAESVHRARSMDNTLCMRLVCRAAWSRAGITESRQHRRGEGKAEGVLREWTTGLRTRQVQSPTGPPTCTGRLLALIGWRREK